jgi:capsule polysaccharide export protein KpsE/RkpR
MLLVSFFVSFFVIDPIYYSNSVVQASEKPTGLDKILGGGLIDIGQFGELAGASTGSTELALFEQILYSRTCLESLIVRYKLMDQYNYKYMYDALKYVKEEVVDISRNKISGTMSIGVYDKDPVKAKEMVEFLIQQLNTTYINLTVLNAKNNREFLSKRYDDAKKDLTLAEDSLRMFQERYGVAPDVKIKSALQAQLQLEATLMSEEVKLDLMNKMLSSDQPEIKEQQNKISALKTQVEKIKNSTSEESDISLKGAPEIGIGYYRLQRNVEIHNKIVTTLIPLFEQAKLQEKKDTPSLLVIDYPNVPDKKSKPKRLFIIGGSVFLGFIFVYLYLFIYTFLYARIRIIRQRVSDSIN